MAGANYSVYADLLYPDNEKLDMSKTLPMEAASSYGFLKNHSVNTIVNLKDNEGYAETWPSDEPGDASWPRPSSLPMGQSGVEIKRKDFSAKDWAAEVFSHIDEKGIGYAKQLVDSMSKDQKSNLIKESGDYQMSIDNGMPENAAMRNAGMSALRGYVFGQWPEEAIKKLGLNKEQMDMLEKAKKYAIEGE